MPFCSSPFKGQSHETVLETFKYTVECFLKNYQVIVVIVICKSLGCFDEITH
jgi:hypothetical protein